MPPNVHKFQHLLILMGIFLSFYKSFRKMQRGKAGNAGNEGTAGMEQPGRRAM